MLKVLLASNDTAYMKDLINLALGNNLDIKIVSVVSKVQEVLNILKNNHEIDLLLLDVSILGKNPIKFLDSKICYLLRKQKLFFCLGKSIFHMNF